MPYSKEPLGQNSATRSCSSLRAALRVEFSEIIEEAEINFSGIVPLVCEIAALVSGYSEEEKALFLDVYVTNNLSNIVKLIPESHSIQFGAITLKESEQGLLKLFKKIAPLAKGYWKVFIEVADEINFGLFRCSGHPLNLPIDKLLASPDCDAYKFIRVRRECKSILTVSNHRAHYHSVDFSRAVKDVVDSSRNVEKISRTICSNVAPGIRETCTTYCTSYLHKALLASHGALIGVVKNKRTPLFRDCAKMEPVLDFPELVANARKFSSENDKHLARLLATEELAIGLFGCDGIVLFNTRFQIIGYNAFICGPNAVREIAGGARSRAYQDLSSHKSVVAAFMQSQDGHTKFSEIQQ